MKLYEMIKKSYIEPYDIVLLKEIVIKAYESNCYEIAMIYMEEVSEIVELDEDLLKTKINIYSKLKNYDEIIKSAKIYLSTYGYDIKIIHEYFKAIEKADEFIGEEDIEYLSFLFKNDGLKSPERHLIVSYNKDKNDKALWDMVSKSKEIAEKRKNYTSQGEKIYSDDRWEVYLIYRSEYIPNHYSWCSIVKVSSLIDNHMNSIYVLDNSSLEILSYKLNIKYVRDSLYKQKKDSFVRLDCKIRVDCIQERIEDSIS